MRTRQALVSTVREIVRSPGVQYLRNKERERIKKREKAKKRFSSVKNLDATLNENKNVTSKNENFESVDNFDSESGGKKFEDFKLTLSVPFAYSAARKKYLDAGAAIFRVDKNFSLAKFGRQKTAKSFVSSWCSPTTLSICVTNMLQAIFISAGQLWICFRFSWKAL